MQNEGRCTVIRALEADFFLYRWNIIFSRLKKPFGVERTLKLVEACRGLSQANVKRGWTSGPRPNATENPSAKCLPITFRTTSPTPVQMSQSISRSRGFAKNTDFGDQTLLHFLQSCTVFIFNKSLLNTYS